MQQHDHDHDHDDDDAEEIGTAETGTEAEVGTDATGRDRPEQPELDPDEGADAFETLEEAREGEHRSGSERDDGDHISMDPPD